MNFGRKPLYTNRHPRPRKSAMRWCRPGPGAGRPTGRGPAGEHGSGGVGEGAGRKPRGPGPRRAGCPHPRTHVSPSLAALHCSPRCWVGTGHQPQGPGLTLEVLPSRLADPKSPRSPPMSRPSTGLPTPTPVSPPSPRATCAVPSGTLEARRDDHSNRFSLRVNIFGKQPFCLSALRNTIIT